MTKCEKDEQVRCCNVPLVVIIESAIREAMRYCHNTEYWEESDGAWENYIAPMLAKVGEHYAITHHDPRKGAE